MLDLRYSENDTETANTFVRITSAMATKEIVAVPSSNGSKR